LGDGLELLAAVVRETYVHGASIRNAERPDEGVRVGGTSRSEVSRIRAEPNAEVEAFRSRPISWEHHYLRIEATYQARQDGRVLGIARRWRSVSRATAELRSSVVRPAPRDAALWTKFLRGVGHGHGVQRDFALSALDIAASSSRPAQLPALTSGHRAHRIQPTAHRLALRQCGARSGNGAGAHDLRSARSQQRHGAWSRANEPKPVRRATTQDLTDTSASSVFQRWARSVDDESYGEDPLGHSNGDRRAACHLRRSTVIACSRAEEF